MQKLPLKLPRLLESDDNKALLITLVLFAVWVAQGLISQELYSDDDLGHFMIARYAPRHPLLFLDVWGRPLVTLLYSPAAQVNITAGRLTSAVLGGLTCYLTYIYARERGYPRAWLIPLLLGVMPRFSGLCYNIETGLVASFVLAAALALYAKGRENLAALTLSFAPLGRNECVLFVFIFVAVFLYRKKWKTAALAFSGLFIWNLAGFLTSWDPLWLLHNNPYGKPYEVLTDGFLHYFRKFVEITGPIHAPMFIAGIYYSVKRWRQKDSLLLPALWGALFLFHVILWGVGATMYTMGLTRYFNPSTPLVALIALYGLNAVIDSAKSRTDIAVTVLIAVSTAFLLASDTAGAKTLIVAAAAVLALRANAAFGGSRRTAERAVVAGILIFAATYYLPIKAEPMHENHVALKNAAEGYKKNAAGEFTLSSDMWFSYFADRDPFDHSQNNMVTMENLEKAPLGAIVVWEPHYAGGERYGNVPVEALLKNPSFAPLWADTDVGVFVFRKSKV